MPGIAGDNKAAARQRRPAAILVAALSPLGVGGLVASVLLLGFLAYCLVQFGGTGRNDNDQYAISVLLQAGGTALLCGVFWLWLARITGLFKASKAVIVAAILLSIVGVILGILFGFVVLAFLRGA